MYFRFHFLLVSGWYNTRCLSILVYGLERQYCQLKSDWIFIPPLTLMGFSMLVFTVYKEGRGEGLTTYITHTVLSSNCFHKNTSTAFPINRVVIWKHFPTILYAAPSNTDQFSTDLSFTLLVNHSTYWVWSFLFTWFYLFEDYTIIVLITLDLRVVWTDCTNITGAKDGSNHVVSYVYASTFMYGNFSDFVQIH